MTPSADTQGWAGGQRGEAPNPWSGKTHRRCLQKLLVRPVQLEGLLVVQVGRSQGDGEVDAASVGQDGILCQGLQSHASVLGIDEEVLSAPGTGHQQPPCPHPGRSGPNQGHHACTLSEGQRPVWLERRVNLGQTSTAWGPRQRVGISAEAEAGSQSQSQVCLSVRRDPPRPPPPQPSPGLHVPKEPPSDLKPVVPSWWALSPEPGPQ